MKIKPRTIKVSRKKRLPVSFNVPPDVALRILRQSGENMGVYNFRHPRHD